MNFRTIVKLDAGPVRLTPASRVVLLGSCFAAHVGDRLHAALPDGHVEANPFGVLYNPASIADSVELLLDDEATGCDCLFEGRDGLWHSRRHAGDFSAETRGGCEDRIRQRLLPARGMLRAADLLCITFGTARAYRHRATGLVVANCHKEPAGDYEEFDLDVEDIVERWACLLERLSCVNPHLHVVFTVSPYRYAKYGLHGSQLSKARLMLAIDGICRRTACSSYFPAYELVVDDLRDYRFYDADMLHPSAQAVDYVWERFGEWAFAPELHEYAREKAALLRDEHHRMLRPDSEAARDFVLKREERKRRFEEKWNKIHSATHNGGPLATQSPSAQK